MEKSLYQKSFYQKTLDTIKLLSDKVMEMIESTYKNPVVFGIIALIANIIFIGSLYYWNPYEVVEKYPIYSFLVILIVLLFSLMTFFFIHVKADMTPATYIPLFDNYKQYIKENVYLLSYLIATVVAIYLISAYLHKNDLGLMDIFMNILNYSTWIGGFAVLYILIKNSLPESTTSESGIIPILLTFLRDIIFYIPCFFIDIIELIREEYKITTSTIWLVLLIEIILIIFYFLFPIAFNSITTHDGIHLLNQCMYLNRHRTLGTYDILHKIDDKKSPTHENSENSKFKYKYALSAWYYINPQPPNTSSAYTKYTTILNYGKKPLIQYNSSKNILRVQCEKSKDNIVTLYESKDIKFQKWNNVVINYDSGTMDIFINGVLVSSTPEIAPYMTYENIDAGQDNGIQGGICNVVYYKNKTLSSTKINLGYKVLRDKLVPLI
jgi:hypothetical protein